MWGSGERTCVRVCVSVCFNSCTLSLCLIYLYIFRLSRMNRWMFGWVCVCARARVCVWFSSCTLTLCLFILFVYFRINRMHTCMFVCVRAFVWVCERRDV